MTVTLEITSTYLALKGGDFDTRYKYLTKDASSPLFNLVAGPTIAIATGADAKWAYKVGSYAIGEPDANGDLVAVSNTLTGVSV